MAPEVLRNHGKGGKGYTEKADVWSVGCTVIEMMTAQRPWPQFTDNESVMFHVAMQSHARPDTPAWASPECVEFLALCFARDPDSRYRCLGVGCGDVPENPWPCMRACAHAHALQDKSRPST